MMRKTALIVAVCSVGLAGCQASFRAGGADEPETPPPPPPATAEPAPAPAPAPDPKPEPPPKKVTVDAKGRINVPGNLLFEHNKATLQAGAETDAVLAQLKKFLDENPRVTAMRIEGHTDNVGQPAANQELSGNRALTIKKWLVDNGIPKERVIAVGFGETRPVADNSTDEGKAQNRRTEFHIAKINGKDYLGMDPTRGGKVFDL